MCGIAVELRPRTPGEVPVARIGKMLAEIAHRGDPENAGGARGLPGAALGCNRLAIVDRESAIQPMTDSTGTLWVAFNGEIYNHAALRRELRRLGHTVRTGSDTEILLHGYREWGRDLPARLDGMFAFVVYDVARRAYLAARDRFGVKPLYRATDGDAEYFASEMKCFLPFGLTPEIFPAGHWTDGRTTVRYHEEPERPPAGTDRSLVAEFGHLLDEAVRKRVDTDLPIGVIYSGGLDSASVLALAARHHPDVTAISVGFPGSSDLAFAVRSCADLGIRHVVRHLSLDGLVRDLPKRVREAETFETVDIMDASVMAPAFETAAELGLKVALVGDGSDELLAGYDLFREHPDPVELMRYRVGNLHRTDLQRVDRVAMHRTVEARVPFLDRDLADFAWRLPMDVKYRDGTEKWVLREAMAGILPPYLARRPKIRMPEGTGLLYQLLEHVKGQWPHRAPGRHPELRRRIGLDQPDAAYLLELYLEHGYPLPRSRHKRPGWDFAPHGYFAFPGAGAR
ncbi:hypothetical protein ADK47_18690 [Streptomyces rimosus subsp. rimosus]|uniref:asparagine synthase (glutamine-hydrolyzing) n=1 Tax=Streptomyces rimosus subsp. rimosus TaxID=132474 RepID=A0ABY3ZCV9_STRRM|nr:hypothetical protein ADK78_12575 [Kitasatospora aureofaciens]KOT46386.1 hypothetical protein ADK42_01000 [Streptomyces rimosus subsp. rimosus]KOT47603.1 hypothetical protein ADK84_00995 [Streptomyces sp. NRRL WC-3701]QDA08808.1 asparagine synthetase B [Streptomyces rimosus]KOT61887.1 hypothetical protein ADK44_14375 [Streptomyces rimosus subsp. rimosus]